MNELIKDNWNEDNIKQYYDLLYEMKNEDKVLWTKNIINTNMEVLAINSTALKDIAKTIYKGNYISFLDIMPRKNHECMIVNAYLISKIKDFKLQQKYILKIAKYIDSWSVVDTFKYNIKNQEHSYLNFAKELVLNKKPFYRRIGVRILFSFISYQNYISDIFDIIDILYDEDEYYVNMATAWLLCELFIKRRNETVEYLNNHHLNKFTLNKFISKCSDSFRVSQDDKEMLKEYRTSTI